MRSFEAAEVAYGNPHDDSSPLFGQVGWDISDDLRLNFMQATPDDDSQLVVHVSQGGRNVRREVNIEQVETFAHLLRDLALKHRHRIGAAR
jgi:hypothetical protein